MPRALPSRLSAILVVLLLVGTVAAQTRAIVIAGAEHRGAQHCCMLCHAGPMALLPSAPPPSAVPAFRAARLDAAPMYAALYEAEPAAPSTRAPPA